MQDVWKVARERIKKGCKVCPVCNGVACAGQIPGMGGVGSGRSFINNFNALGQVRLNMRVLHNARTPDLSLELFGKKLSMPVMAAPVGSIVWHFDSNMTDREYMEAIADGCAEAGTFSSVGDLPDVTGLKNYLAQLGPRCVDLVPFIKPWTAEGITERLEMIAAAGCRVCGMDVDSAGLTGVRDKVRPLPGRELEAVVRQAHGLGLKFIVKGVMCTDEAVLAADAGADGLVVSNHGGRALDHTPGSIEVLPAIAELVGHRLVVMHDGALRSGYDVLKALALGARCVMICRPVIVASFAGKEGVAKYFNKIRQELDQAMLMTGCASLADIGKRVVG